MTENIFGTELEPIADTKVSPATGIGAVALTLAMKFYDINTVQEGALYQQYKLEGKNMNPLHLDMVFEAAIQIEKHLLNTSERIAKIVIDCVETAVIEEEPDKGESST